MVDSFMVDALSLWPIVVWSILNEAIDAWRYGRIVDLGIVAESPQFSIYLYFYLHTMNFLPVSVCCRRETKMEWKIGRLDSGFMGVGRGVGRPRRPGPY